MGKFGGNLFLRERKIFLRETDSFRQNCKISSFLHRNTFRMNLKNFYLSALLWCAPKPWFYSNFSTQLTSISLFNRTKITYTFPFHRLPAASSPHCNFDFPQNPILRQHCNRPFPPVQNMAVRIAALINFRKKT